MAFTSLGVRKSLFHRDLNMHPSYYGHCVFRNLFWSSVRDDIRACNSFPSPDLFRDNRYPLLNIPFVELATTLEWYRLFSWGYHWHWQFLTYRVIDRRDETDFACPTGIWHRAHVANTVYWLGVAQSLWLLPATNSLSPWKCGTQRQGP